MTNTIKFFIANRFMWILGIFTFALVVCLCIDRPYVNLVITIASFVFAFMGIAYMDNEKRKKNAQERLFTSKMMKMFS